MKTKEVYSASDSMPLLDRLLSFCEGKQASMTISYTNSPKGSVFGKVQISISEPGHLSKGLGSNTLKTSCERMIRWLKIDS